MDPQTSIGVWWCKFHATALHGSCHGGARYATALHGTVYLCRAVPCSGVQRRARPCWLILLAESTILTISHGIPSLDHVLDLHGHWLPYGGLPGNWTKADAAETTSLNFEVEVGYRSRVELSQTRGMQTLDLCIEEEENKAPQSG
ncbi:hypothetical protein K438DRAFT_1758094 [Mycena galopus ATCC 62051]|nr:hypothetical protein K438DRAFT_1758094 [Mycena galopus ATCC 62051]